MVIDRECVDNISKYFLPSGFLLVCFLTSNTFTHYKNYHEVCNKIVWEGTISLSRVRFGLWIWLVKNLKPGPNQNSNMSAGKWVDKNMLYFIFDSSCFPCLKKNVWKRRGKCDIIVDIIKSRDYCRVAQCKNLLCNAVDVSLIPGWKTRSHRPWGNETDMPKLKNSCATWKNECHD